MDRTKWIANLEDECDECSRSGTHNHIMKGTYHISSEFIEEDECPYCGCDKPKITNIKWEDPYWKNKPAEIPPQAKASGFLSVS
jgi:hypothetical protein